MRDADREQPALVRREPIGVSVDHHDGGAAEHVEALLGRVQMGVDASASGERAQREPGMDRTDMPADEGSSSQPADAVAQARGWREFDLVCLLDVKEPLIRHAPDTNGGRISRQAMLHTQCV